MRGESALCQVLLSRSVLACILQGTLGNSVKLTAGLNEMYSKCWQKVEVDHILAQGSLLVSKANQMPATRPFERRCP